jgi:hypothetical protein
MTDDTLVLLVEETQSQLTRASPSEPDMKFRR